MTKQHIKLMINEDNLLSRLGEAFTNKDTFIKEIMQNAQRSGASKLDIRTSNNTLDTTDNTISFIDDGKGIEDFQYLLSVAESGWDTNTQQQTNAFGIGFLSSIYASDTVEVKSGYQFIRFKTKDLLKGHSIEVETLPRRIKGTTVILTGTFKTDNLESYTTGFGIPVTINGVAAIRKNALNKEAFIKTDFGWIKLNGDTTIASKLYLQGQEVFDEPYRFGSRNIIHLNDAMFLARLPDRDKLIDEQEVIDKIHNWIEHHYHHKAQQMLNKINKHSDVNDIENAFAFARQWNKKALNKLDFIPASDFIDMDSVDLRIGHDDYADSNDWQMLNGIFTKDDLLNKTIFEADRSFICEEQMDCFTFCKMDQSNNTLIFLNAWTYYNKNHWLFDMMTNTDNTVLQVKAIDGHKKVKGPEINWLWKQAHTTFCRGYHLTLRFSSNGIDKEISTTVEQAQISIFSHAMFEYFITDTSSNYGALEALFSSIGFFNEDGHDESAEDMNSDLFMAFIRRHRTSNTVELLKELLSSEIKESIVPKALIGKTVSFRWDYNDDNHIEVVDLKIA